MNNRQEFLQRHLWRLKQLQNNDGSFSHASFTVTGKQTSLYITTFSASLIVQSLFVVPESKEKNEIVILAKEFLRSQKEKDGSYSYWAKGQDILDGMQYSPDLDDTFAAHTALSRGENLSPRTLAELTELLLSCEEKEGGPYRTWCTTEEGWHDVDLVVNANISYLFSLNDIHLPALTSFIDEAIREENLFSPYYPSLQESLSILYFIARGYCGNQKEKLMSLFLSRRTEEGSFGTVLDTALAISSLLRLGYPRKNLEKSIGYVYENQDQGKIYPFCCDPMIEKEQYYAGSEALTIALCLEAICLYEKEEPLVSAPSKMENLVFSKVVGKIRKRFSLLPLLTKEIADRFLEKIISSRRSEEIVLLPYLFYKDFKKEKEIISEETIVSLCTANVYGWIAYTIYDDMVDREGEVELLPIANICLREMCTIFLSSPSSKYVQKILDTLESATVWEMVHCRNVKDAAVSLPVYPHGLFLADRSLGHMLGCIHILFLLGYDQKSIEVQSIENFFRYYLAARQLEDELHDWKEDLMQGQLNYVSTTLISEYKIQNYTILKDILSPEFLRDLEEFFWRNTMPPLVRLVLNLVENAQKHLFSISHISSFSYLFDLCKEVERSSQKTLEEQKHTIEFFSFFQNKTPSREGVLMKNSRL